MSTITDLEASWRFEELLQVALAGYIDRLYTWEERGAWHVVATTPRFAFHTVGTSRRYALLSAVLDLWSRLLPGEHWRLLVSSSCEVDATGTECGAPSVLPAFNLHNRRPTPVEVDPEVIPPLPAPLPGPAPKRRGRPPKAK